jgi:hypothetical protein
MIMRKWTVAVLVAVGMTMLSAGAYAGCGKCAADNKKTEKHKHEWCGKCGEVESAITNIE